MRKFSFLVLLLLLTAPVCIGQKVKGIKIAIENSTDVACPAADIVLSIPSLRKVAPDLTPGSLMVTATNAASVDEDAAILSAEELPSQVDDMDGDGKGDELAFQIDLAAHQTRMVTVSYGELERILRLRQDYPQRTNALFSKKFEGLGWESDRVAFRVYFDPRNAIDIWGKRRPTLQLKLYAAPDYPYHNESPEGRDIFRVGSAIGIGGFAAWADGHLIKAAEVQQRNWRIVSTGPVRSIVELEYEGWRVGAKSVDLHSRITQWAGERGFYQTISTNAADASEYVTGFPTKHGVTPLRSAATVDVPMTWMASWGEQVVAPGPDVAEAIAGQNLGLAVITNAPHPEAAEDAGNHLLKFRLQNGTATWYSLAAWDQEGTNRRVGFGNQHEMRSEQSLVLPPDGIATQSAFLAAVQDQARRMAFPARIEILSKTAAAQSAPPDTLVPHGSKSIAEAIDLLSQNIERTVRLWQPVLNNNTPEDLAAGTPLGFFEEADNQTGEWRKQVGFSWTAGFWVGELWQLYARTHEEKCRQWAEMWGKLLMGHEAQQFHDVGNVYFYAAAKGYDLTKEDDQRESALRAAARLAQLYVPQAHLISAWGEGGDDSIIDTMMNLQILWWASDRTGDPHWRELGLKHALRSAEWLVRPDGSTIQSVLFNPGDNRQEFLNNGSNLPKGKIYLANTTAPGDWVFYHTHQGFAADTSWSRGTGWGLYFFTRAYEETKDRRLLDTAYKIADYVLANLPDDAVPWYDFDDEGVHFRNRDTSAGAILAGGFFRISQLTEDKKQAERYRREGERMVQALIDGYLTPVGAEDKTPPGVLRHGCYLRPGDTMLIFGQYYLLEDLLWLEQHTTGAHRGG